MARQVGLGFLLFEIARALSARDRCYCQAMGVKLHTALFAALAAGWGGGEVLFIHRFYFLNGCGVL